MLSRIVAGWLIIIAVLPFTAPFSTVTLESVFGQSPNGPSKTDPGTLLSSLAEEFADTGAAFEATDFAINQTGTDVRPAAMSRYDTPLIPVSLPGTQVLGFGLHTRPVWIVSPAARQSALAQSPAILRV
jgi:hypothetical protein